MTHPQQISIPASKVVPGDVLPGREPGAPGLRVEAREIRPLDGRIRLILLPEGGTAPEGRITRTYAPHKEVSLLRGAGPLAMALTLLESALQQLPATGPTAEQIRSFLASEVRP
jgi:hypothetical protein